MERRTYTAKTRRADDEWVIEVPEVLGAVTQAKRFDEVEATAREVVSLLLGLPENWFDVRVVADA